MSDVVADVKSFAKSLWWLAILRGVLAIIIGIIALVSPAGFALGVVILIAVYLLLDGLTFLYYGVKYRNDDSGWAVSLTLGVIAVLAAIAIVVWPVAFGLATGLIVLWILAIANLVGGIVETVGVLRENPKRDSWGWLLAGGLLSVAFGVLLTIVLIANPLGALTALIWVFGIYAIVIGVFFIVAAIVLRSNVKQVTSEVGEIIDGSVSGK